MRHVVEQLGAVDMVYISSGAATSVQHGEPVAHRTAVYGQAKIDDEVAYAETIASTGGRLCIIRAFALSGPYMTKPETYALGSLILQAQRSGAIEVVADRLVRRSYMAMDDMLRIAIHAVGDLGPGGTLRFETAGEVVEVGDLARRVLSVVGEDPTAITRPAIAADAPPNDYLGDPAVLSALAVAAGIVPASLDDQIAATAKWLLAGATS
jgi:nucleoside-diphosphate-sugar epimerase